MMDATLNSEETIAFGDQGYRKANRTLKNFGQEGNLSVIIALPNLRLARKRSLPIVGKARQ